MRAENPPGVFYWDSSAVLSALVADGHTSDARGRLSSTTFHLVSTLGFAEVMSVLSRIDREQSAEHGSPRTDLRAIRQRFVRGPWRWTQLGPERDICADLSIRHGLRGADLWHLALAVTLQRELPELALLTYDSALLGAAAAEGLWPRRRTPRR